MARNAAEHTTNYTDDPLDDWQSLMNDLVAEYNPEAVGRHTEYRFMQPLPPEVRQGLLFINHEAFHQTEHHDTPKDAHQFAQETFDGARALLNSQDKWQNSAEQDFHHRAVSHIIDNAQIRFANQFSNPESKAVDYASHYNSAMRWADPESELDSTEQRSLAKNYATFYTITAFDTAFNELKQLPDNPIAQQKASLEYVMATRHRDDILEYPDQMDQKYVDQLCEHADHGSAKLLIAIHGGTAYPNDQEPPEFPNPDLSTAQALTHLATILEAAPEIRDDWPELVYVARVTSRLADQSEDSQAHAHRHLLLLHTFAWGNPPTG